MRLVSARLLSAFALALGVACHRPSAHRPSNAATPTFDPVPALAPNFQPGVLIDTAAMVALDSTGVVLLNRYIVIVMFQESATQAARQAAVDSVGGVVVGGRSSLGGPDGFYYVQVKGDSSGVAVRHAANRLTAMPQVSSARPYDYFTLRCDSSGVC